MEKKLGQSPTISTRSGYQANYFVPGITASVITDAMLAAVSRDLCEHIAPGTSFRIGGSQEYDEAEFVGSAAMPSNSPILSNVQLTNDRNHLFVGERVRIASDTYSIANNGIEVQQLTVHRSSAISDGAAYQL